MLSYYSRDTTDDKLEKLINHNQQQIRNSHWTCLEYKADA